MDRLEKAKSTGVFKLYEDKNFRVKFHVNEEEYKRGLIVPARSIESAVERVKRMYGEDDVLVFESVEETYRFDIQ